MAERQREPWSVTAKELSDLLKALPKAIANTVKRAVANDWREPRSSKDEKDSSFQQLQNSMPMGYVLVYESKDGKMCLYRDKDGHLLAADTTKFI